MGKLACLFPGQGSQSVGMGFDLKEANEKARETFALIDRLAGRGLSEICFAGPEEELKRTINTQPTILAVSLAAWQAYRSRGGPLPQFVAGHSLGEFSALAAAGALTIEAAVKVVARRAELMEECPPGAMSAVIGLPPEALEGACREASADTGKPVIVANFNTREQLVISGDPKAVDRAGELARALKGKVIPLPVGGAFHSPLMRAAAAEFESEIDKYSFEEPAFAVVQNYDAQASTKASVLKDKLKHQMPSAVRWCESIEYMLLEGVDTFVEIGPGKALAGMVKKIERSARVFNIYDGPTLEETLAGLGQLSSVT